MTGLHSRVTPAEALKKRPLERHVSSADVPEPLKSVVVGYYECHSPNGTNHKDCFEHFDFKIHVVVSPPDCRVCHADEAAQFAASKKAYALTNLQQNPVYHTMLETLTGARRVKEWEAGACCAVRERPERVLLRLPRHTGGGRGQEEAGGECGRIRSA